MIDFTKLNLTEAPTPQEQAASDSAAMSSDKQQNGIRRQRQKDQMAQKTPVSKSGVVYASEEYFTQLRQGSQLIRAQDKARQDWRQDLEEHRGEPAAQASDEGNHPYVRLMPRTNRVPQQKKEQKMQEIQSESVSFCEAFDNLVEKEMSIADQMKLARKKPPVPKGGFDHMGARAKAMAKAPKDKPKSAAERMADAYASPRKGPGGQRRAD